MEQTLEWNTGLHMVFVDFEKAFDSIDQEVLWKFISLWTKIRIFNSSVKSVHLYGSVIDKEDHHPTSDLYQSQTPVHLGSVVAQKNLE